MTPSPAPTPPLAPDHPATGRQAAARSITHAAAHFPNLGPTTLDTAALSPEESRLALAIHRSTIQRWITLETILNAFLRQPIGKLEPALRAVLLTGAAQLLFMQRLPAYAVVDQAVNLAGRMVRPGAAGMVNAVLRKLTSHTNSSSNDPWTAGPTAIPLEGGSLTLKAPLLPDPANLVDHLCAATSHPRRLVRRWIKCYGPEITTRICLHGIVNPPIIVAVESSFPTTPDAATTTTPTTPTSSVTPAPAPGQAAGRIFQPHQKPGFICWHADHPSLVEFLAADRHRRVQDPASALAVDTLGDLAPDTILDLCAGRGTKTRQLAARFPHARITATDTDPTRRRSLAQVAAAWPNVHVIAPDNLTLSSFDLILLDVPCSNTGVLGRRPEARYRFNQASLASLVKLQRQIVARAVPLLAPAGHLLYSTCSLEPEENQQQTAWIIEQTRARLIHEQLHLPAGRSTTHHDGGYHALIGPCPLRASTQ